MTRKPQDDAQSNDGLELIDRRAAIQKGVVGAGVAGAVWAAPKVQGLSFRPAYAAAATAATVSQTLIIDTRPGPVNNPSNLGSGTLLCEGNPTYSVDYIPGDGFFPPSFIQLTGLAAVPASACLTVTSMIVEIAGQPDQIGGPGLGGTTAPDAGIEVTFGQPAIIFAQNGGVITIEYECVPAVMG